MCGNSTEPESERSNAFEDVLQGTIIIFIGTVSGLALGFLARLVPARLLGPDQYGMLMLGWTTVAMLGFVAKLGFKDGVTRHIPRANSEPERKSVVVTAVSITLPWSLFLAFGLVLLAQPISTHIFGEPELSTIIRSFALLLPVTTLTTIVVATFRGYERASERVIVKNILNPGLRTLFITIAVLGGYSVFGAAIGWVIAATCTLSVGVWLLSKSTGIFNVNSASLRHKELFWFSAPLMISGVMGLALNFGDNFLIGFFLDSGAVGIYDPAYMLAGLVATGLSVFSYMFLPIFSRLHSDEKFDEMGSFYRITTKWIISSTLPVYLVISIFSESVLAGIFGGTYASGAVALSIISTGYFVNSSVGLCVQALVSIGETRFIMAVNMVTATANILLNILLIPQYGIVGAALASAIATAGYNILYTYQLYRTTSITPIPKTIIGPVVLTTSFAIALSRLLDGILPLPLLGGLLLAFVAVYLIIYMALGAVEEEDLKFIDIIEDRSGTDLSFVRRLVRYRLDD